MEGSSCAANQDLPNRGRRKEERGKCVMVYRLQTTARLPNGGLLCDGYGVHRQKEIDPDFKLTLGRLKEKVVAEDQVLDAARVRVS